MAGQDREVDEEVEVNDRMMKLTLKYVQAFFVGSKRFYYFRRRGLPRVRLPGLPGSAEFMTVYQDTLAAQLVAIGMTWRSKPGSVSAALADYYMSQDFRALTGDAPIKRRFVLESFRKAVRRPALGVAAHEVHPRAARYDARRQGAATGSAVVKLTFRLVMAVVRSRPWMTSSTSCARPCRGPWSHGSGDARGSGQASD